MADEEINHMTATTPDQSPNIRIWWEDLEIGQVRDLEFILRRPARAHA